VNATSCADKIGQKAGAGRRTERASKLTGACSSATDLEITPFAYKQGDFHIVRSKEVAKLLDSDECRLNKVHTLVRFW
jgi:hypothetical protein